MNAYTAEEAGQRVIEEHREEDGHEELYVVVGPRDLHARGDEHDAPAGTLVHCPPGTLRGAIAAEPGTTVLGIGAKPGEVFQPSGGSGRSRPSRAWTEATPRPARGARGRDRAYPDAWQG